jgi:hypothetical protein
MKTLIILLLTLLFPIFAIGETMDDLVERGCNHHMEWSDLMEADDFAPRGCIHYKKFSDVPFTGKTTGYMQGSFKNGKKDGKKVASVSYHDNGQLWEKPSYQDGKLDGLWVSYHDNGQLLFKGIYKDGELGPWTSFHADGTIRSCGNGVVWESCPGTYKNGVKVE